ncbi:outer membrane beta-barrel protein [Chitinophaga oryziterrae]|uniref:Outer membrane beta-barrel protein n=1 Tax=Chitinophaga oryziterrae TaxID=1031224 RepID=A0A6N8JDA5_9BACT|nr:porin [Chitinophaga oryziterrae]MVT42368.1 outer membrane beta-barrel protein [Chitinophaga oryziterrae]
MKRLLICLLSSLEGLTVCAQSVEEKPLKVTGYLETYYSYDFGKPGNNLRPGFLYSYNRHNEVNINLGYIKAAYEKDNVRANLALMAGTYANANLAAERGVMRNVFEANAGVKIMKEHQLWIDAGIFASHIGFESAIGKDCWNLTRSILAENSPYYESGVRVSYTSSNDKWYVSGLFLNGWQRIQRVDGNHTPAFGHQVTFKPNDKLVFNSSSFIGNDKPDSVKQMRYFHNFYALMQFSGKLGLIAGFDIGAEQKAKGSSGYNTWYSPVLILRYKPVEKVAIAARGEYYRDEKGVIIATATPDGFQTWGYSLNFDYTILDNVMWRIEGRGFSGKDAIFLKDATPSTTNFSLTTSLAISF